MTAKEPYELLIDGLHARAVEDFEQTEEALLLGEKIVQIDRDCDTELLPDQKAFVVECFETLQDIDSQRESFVYRRGMADGVWLLKRLGVLA